MEYSFRKATLNDLPVIWEILQHAIKRRKEEGSTQWQDGYPNSTVIQEDIDKGSGYVLTDGDRIIGYCAILVNDEPAYEEIVGKWLTNGDFIVFHRVAISKDYLGKGLSRTMLNSIEAFARDHHIKSVKADTNFDNAAMLHVFKQAGYAYCGEVHFRGAARKAYEKVL